MIETRSITITCTCCFISRAVKPTPKGGAAHSHRLEKTG
jgi:hypothetical protein